MRFSFTVKTPPSDLIPPIRELAQAAGRGISNAVKRHLVSRDTRGRADGLPRTGYWGDAASSVTTEVTGALAVVTIHKEGAALHYYGGVVYPVDAKALAIPKTAAAAGKRPREFDPSREKLALVWPKGEKAGSLRDRETDETVYLLVARAPIPADPSVIPSDDELVRAANDAMESII